MSLSGRPPARPSNGEKAREPTHSRLGEQSKSLLPTPPRLHEPANSRGPDLLERALMRRLILTPAYQLRPVAKSIAGDMVC